MNEDAQPTTGELLQAIVALHAFTEAGLQRLDAKIDGVDRKIDVKTDGVDRRIDGLRYEMNKRFDHVYGELDEIKSRVTRLEPRPT